MNPIKRQIEDLEVGYSMKGMECSDEILLHIESLQARHVGHHLQASQPAPMMSHGPVQLDPQSQLLHATEPELQHSTTMDHNVPPQIDCHEAESAIQAQVPLSAPSHFKQLCHSRQSTRCQA